MATVNTDKILTSKIINKFLYYFNTIENRNNINAHWLWTNAIWDGYGRFKVDNIEYRAHRISYLYYNNLLTTDLLVLHTRQCNIRNCINPNHLYLGTDKDNRNDCIITNKYYKPYGELNHQAKITKEIVLKIRFEYEAFNLSQKDLAKIYHISQQHICDIINKKKWKHI